MRSRSNDPKAPFGKGKPTAFLDSILKISADGVIVQDREGRIVYCNPSAERIIGQGKSGIIGSNAAQIMLDQSVIQEDGSPFPGDRRPSLEVFRTGLPQRDVIMGFHRPNGDLVWIKANADVVEWDQGVAALVVSSFSDVTSLVEAKKTLQRQEVALEEREAELREANVRFVTLLENLPGTVFRFLYRKDSPRQLLYRNNAFFTERGLPHHNDYETMSQADYRAIFHPDDIDLIFNELPRRLAETGSSEHRFRYRGQNGQSYWVMVKERVVERQGDDFITEGLAVDISKEMEVSLALEQREAELQASAARLKTIVENIPGIVYSMRYCADGTTKLSYIGGGDSDKLPLSAEELRSMPYEARLALFHRDDHREILVETPRRLRAHGVSERRQCLFWPDGTISWYFFRETLVGRDGDDLLVEGLAVDISEEMQAKQALLLEEAELRRLERQAHISRKLEVLGQLAGGIAHDFNNLLAAMLGFASFIVEDCAADHPAAAHAQRILATGRRGKALVDQILTFARQRGQLRSRFRVAEMVMENIDLLRVTTPSTTHFVTEIADADAIIDADRSQIGQVVINLILNAHDALGNRPGVVSVTLDTAMPEIQARKRLAMRTDPKMMAVVDVWADKTGADWAVSGHWDGKTHYVSIVIEDNGPGIDRAILEEIFLPFVTTKGHGAGTGLGLAVVHGIILAHGGALIVRSKATCGTRMQILLPRAVGSVSEVPLEITGHQPATLSGRILVVDDDADFVDMLTIALERRGLEVAPCTAPDEALAAVRQDPDTFDAVITDQIMPKLRGLDLMTEIKVLKPGMPCILCSGWTEGLTNEQVYRAGATAFITKPVDIDALLAILADALSGRGLSID